MYQTFQARVKALLIIAILLMVTMFVIGTDRQCNNGILTHDCQDVNSTFCSRRRAINKPHCKCPLFAPLLKDLELSFGKRSQCCYHCE